MQIADRQRWRISAYNCRKGFTGSDSLGIAASVLEKASLEKAKEEINTKFGTINFLVNAAGGNNPKGTTQKEFLDQTDN